MDCKLCFQPYDEKAKVEKEKYEEAMKEYKQKLKDEGGPPTPKAR